MVQIRALYEAGWLHPLGWVYVDVTAHGDSCRWYLLCPKRIYADLLESVARANV